MIEKFYEEELRYLYDSGREFAKAHPDRARFLNIDAVGDRDPYVERLFEGFAFLAGRIREKLDDSFPELSEGLINLMWPSFVQEIPSLAMIQFQCRKGILQEARVIERGASLLSNPAGPEAVACRFMTTQQVVVNPFTLVNVERQVDTKGRETVTFDFAIDSGIPWQKLSLAPLRIYLYAEMPTAMSLHRFMTRQVQRAVISVDKGRHVVEVNPAEAVTPGGLREEESLLPVDPRAFWGHMLLMEYFCFPEKFLFVDLHGFEAVPFLDPPPARFSYSLTFDSSFPPNRPFSTENFRLSCTPAVNMYTKDTEPIVYSGKEVDYRVVADSEYPGSVQAHSILSVAGIDRATGERYSYEPFHAFKTLGKKNARTYATKYKTGPDGRRNIWISVGGEQLTGSQLREESLSLNAWCFNGVLPREEVREGGISNPGPGFPELVSFSNITRPTLPFSPPPSEDYLWMFLSHLGATSTTLASADSLQAFLRLYDWSKAEGRRRRIAAISEVTSRPVENVVMGNVLRGVEFTVSVGEAEFQDIGDVHLFGQVLKEFLSYYVTINSFLRLIIVLKPSDETLRWDTLKGRRWLI